MNKRMFAAVAAVVVLGGGSAAFVVWRSANARSAEILAVIEDVHRELAAPTSTVDDRRGLLKRVQALRTEFEAPGLTLVEGELLASIGRAKDGWTAIESLVTGPGARPDAILVGSRVAAATHAVTGDETVGRQALALAADAEHGDGGVGSGFLAWQLAFRVGDVERFAARTLAAIEGGADGIEARTERACGGALATLLAARAGYDTSLTDGGGVVGTLAEVMRRASKVGPRDLEKLALERGDLCPELELAIATATLDNLPAVGTGASDTQALEDQLRIVLARADSALRALPASVEARHVAVIAYAGLMQAAGLGADDSTRMRGFLQWLLANGPPAHTGRPTWIALQRALQ